MGAGDFTAATVRLVFFARDCEQCFRCRRALRWEDRGIGWSAHHRKPRGAGGVFGAAAEAVASPANCLVLCGSGTTGCHGWVEKNRRVSVEMGLLISRLGVGDEFEPARVRVQREDETWWLLTAGGRAVEVEGKTWA